MPDPGEARRRSKRVVAEIPIHVAAGGVEGLGETAVVNEHGALILSAVSAEDGDEIRVTNMVSGESVGCRVVWAGNEDETGLKKYGIELLEERPLFWGFEVE